jgi:hypothetical protein
MKLGELVALVFPGCAPDGRTTEGKSIQAFLAGMDTKAPTTETPIGNQELTDDQKAMVDSLLKDGRVKSSMELAKLVFPDREVKGLSREWRAVHAYAKEYYPDSFSVTEEPVTEAQYTPPTRLQELIGIVNGYVMTGDVNKKTYNPSLLKVSDKRNLTALMAYMRIMRFKYVASTYERQVDRELFISTFIRWAHDKSDLTAMEVDQMISAASETVNIAQMEREIQTIKRYQESIMAGEEVDENGKKRRFGMTDVEMINGVRTKHDQAKARLKILMSDLETVRSKRLDDIKDRNATLLNMFEAWMNDPDWRADIIAAGQREKKEDADEVARIRGTDDIIALISGQSIEEAVG